MITFLIAVPFAIPFIVIGLVKYSDRKNGVQPEADPAGRSVTDSAPASAPEQSKAPKQDMTVSNVLFLIGTAFVVLSGLAFGVASWVHTSHLGRVAIIAAAAAVSFILSAVIGKFLKLSGTSLSFFILGTGFSATALLTAGYYKLMGEWLSFSGDGTCCLLAISSALTAAMIFLGYRVFRKTGLVYAGFAAALSCIYFTVFQIFRTYESRAVVLTVFAAVIIAAFYGAGLLKGKKYELPVKVIGVCSVFINSIIALLYVFSCLRQPTVSAYFIILVIISQLIFYGRMYKNSVLIPIESIFAVFLAYMITMTLHETFEGRYCVIAFGILSVIIYSIHRFIPFFRNTASELITLGTAVAGAFFCIFSEKRGAFIPEAAVASVVSLLIVLYAFNKNKLIQVASGIAAPILPLFITAFTCDAVTRSYRDGDHTDMNIYSLFTFSLMAVSALIMLLPKFAFSFHAAHPRQTDTILYSNLIVSGLIVSTLPLMDHYFIIPAILCGLHFILSNSMKKCNATSIISTIGMINTVYSAVRYSCSKRSIQFILALFAAVIVYAAISRIFFRNGFIFRNNDRLCIDPLLSSAWLAICYMYQPNRTGIFFTLLAAAVYTAAFIKKDTSKPAASSLLTAAASLTTIALIARPYFVPSSKAVSSKINIAIIVLMGIACRYIWREFKSASKTSSDCIFIASAIALLIDALYFDTAANTIFVMSVMLVILVVSIMTRSKTWFIASAAALFTITIYATRDYLMALNWWIYLFIAGVILIGLAAGNEYCKKNNETIKTSVIKKFSGWSW